MQRLFCLALVCLGSTAAAEPERIIRMSSIAPEGTGYARELKAMARDMEAATEGRVKTKVYFGAIAGDEPEAWQRIKRGQLDGIAATILCEELAPSMRIFRVPGLFHSSAEAYSIIGRLRPTFDKEFQAAGVRNLGETVIGPAILFTRHPIQSIDDLRKHVYWVWDADKAMLDVYPMLGMKVLPLPINDAGKAYEAGRHDGFEGPPTAALAYQWSTVAKYYVNLPLAYIAGCLLVASRSFDSLPFADQQAVLGATAKAVARMDQVGRDMDRQLIEGGLFQRQGLKPLPVSSELQRGYAESSKQARALLAKENWIDPALLAKVEVMLAELRASTAK